MSQSRVQSRGRGSNVAAQYEGKKSFFYARYSTVANLQVTYVRVNKIMSQEKT